MREKAGGAGRGGGNKHGDSTFLLEAHGLDDWRISSFKGSNFSLPLSAWMRSLMNEVSPSPPSSAPANQGSRAREPSNSGRGVGREQPIAGRGFLIWIFQLFFIHKKRERRKVRDGEREGKKNSIHKKPALARRVLTCFLFSFFSSSDELRELDFVYLKHTTRLTEKLIKHKWGGNSGTNHCSDSWH